LEEILERLAFSPVELGEEFEVIEIQRCSSSVFLLVVNARFRIIFNYWTNMFSDMVSTVKPQLLLYSVLHGIIIVE